MPRVATPLGPEGKEAFIAVGNASSDTLKIQHQTHARPDVDAIHAAEEVKVMLGWAVAFFMQSARRAR